MLLFFFFKIATLTFDPWLSLGTHPRYCQGQSPHQISGSYTKRFGRERAD